MSIFEPIPNRRQVVGGGVATAVACLAPMRHAGAREPQFTTPLPLPRLVDARSAGGKIELRAAVGSHPFMVGRPTTTYGYSAPFLGPVLRLHAGEKVEMAVSNALAHDITCHWHGLLVPGNVDGGCHFPIRPGTTWRPVLDVKQGESTAWYHSHAHHDTGRQVYMGLAGMILIEDGTAERLGLPRRFGIDDLPLILQDRLLDDQGRLVYESVGPSRMIGMRGDVLLVNGVSEPFVKVPPGLVRLRLLNAANARNFNATFSDGRPFHVIASDGGYLPKPVDMTSLLIAPSERFEILVDFSNGQEAVLATAADDLMGGMRMDGLGMRGMGGMGAMSNAGPLIRFEVDRSLPAGPARLPEALVPAAALPPARGLTRRRVSLDMGPATMRGSPFGGSPSMGRGMGGMGMGRMPMGINGQPFAMDRIEFRPKLGSSEIWEVLPNMMAHPFHVHGVVFHVLAIGGKAPPPHLAGPKDTVLLDQPGEIVMTFTQPASDQFPFMFHCHILEHEDAGMMGLYATS